MTAAETVAAGRATLGIDFGSTNIKVCLVGEDPTDVIAVGSHAWENSFQDRTWTYALDDVWSGMQAAYADVAAQVEDTLGLRPRSFAAIGISAMMHGYLALDTDDNLLVPFRTWRNTSTGPAAAELSQLFGVNIPLRWSIACLHQAVLDAEPHVPQIAHLSTLAGLVHHRLTGVRALGVGDASGMFPIDAHTGDYDQTLLARYDALVDGRLSVPLRSLLPDVLPAGRAAGQLTEQGALLLDPEGTLVPGIPLAPPEGDAGTGMVATNAVSPRSGNISAGTSIFAMVVLEGPLPGQHPEIDLVTTPAGDPVAMVHCNNGSSELAAWAGLFERFAEAAGQPLDADTVYDVLFREALTAEADAGGLLAYNYLAGEPITGLDEGRPLLVRTPESTFSLGNAVRAQLYGVFGTLAIGMQVLAQEGVRLDRVVAHGGLFRTAGVAQRLLAAALDAPVTVGSSASEGTAWGAALLARYLEHAGRVDLGGYLTEVFAAAEATTADPDPTDVAGFTAYLSRYRTGLAVQAAATATL